MEIESWNVRTSQELPEHFFKEFHFAYINSQSQADLEVYQKAHFYDWRNKHWNQYLVKVSFL